ncbi:MAG: recombinase family protein [Planctomycetaceae bacterium]|nr:recombinase family protein [Planctomycetota bacterium]MCK6529681.1 recombinase family protein [Myxococcota bacterium]NUN52094.1 recombinase family protein [Planctomycetaceae bacterium]
MPAVVTYCRVSSEEQAQRDISIPAQRKALVRWVDERPDHRLLAEFVDEGESAYAPADRRPGLCDMIAYCRKHRVSPAAKTRGDPALCAGSPSVWVRIAADRHRGWRDSRGAAVGVGDRARGNQGRGGRICRSARRIFRRRWAAPAISLAR